MEEVPVVEANSSKRFSFIRFEIEVMNKGNVSLAFNSTNGITAWIAGKPAKLTDQNLSADLTPGIHSITLAIDRGAFKEGNLNVQLVEGSGAQTRLVMGR